MQPLIYYEQLYPNWLSEHYPQIEVGKTRVLINRIIGSSRFLMDNYYADFSPMVNELDMRYEQITNMVKDKFQNNDAILDLGLIHIYKFIEPKNAHIYYFVGSDGNRRVSNCKQLHVRYIYADVTEVLISPETTRIGTSLLHIKDHYAKCPNCNSYMIPIPNNQIKVMECHLCEEVFSINPDLQAIGNQ